MKEKDPVTKKVLSLAMYRANRLAIRTNKALGLDTVVARGGKIIRERPDGTVETIKTISKPVRYTGQPTVSIVSDEKDQQ